MKNTAYDDILEYSSIAQFGDFRRVLVGGRGTIASGNLIKGLTLIFDKNQYVRSDVLLETAQDMRKPIGIVQKLGGYNHPGLILNKNGYEEVMRQIESRGEISINSLMDKLKFKTDNDEVIWSNLPESLKRRCITKNLDKLVKETQVQYRIHGDRMHYLTIGLVEVETYNNSSDRYPLFLFSCSELDVNKFKARIDLTGFINFWLDKNIFDSEIGKKLNNNFEVNLDSDLTKMINTISQWMNNINLSAKYKSIAVDPSYMAFQIVTGFEAEYIDPAWTKILQESCIDE